MDGQVVHARRGQRDQYQPLQSPLSPDAEPRSVLAGLLGLARFRTVYVADLDGLMGKTPQFALVDGLVKAFPAITFWLDCGQPVAQWPQALAGVVPIIGSESLTEATLASLACQPTGFILSLDFRDGVLLGPPSLLARPALWPERVILMNLSRVGSFDGPDKGMAERFIRMCPGRQYVVAGGVRRDDDLDQLQAIGAAGVLVASALHHGGLSPDRLAARLQNPD